MSQVAGNFFAWGGIGNWGLGRRVLVDGAEWVVGMLRLRSDDHFVIVTAALCMTGDAYGPCYPIISCYDIHVAVHMLRYIRRGRVDRGTIQSSG